MTSSFGRERGKKPRRERLKPSHQTLSFQRQLTLEGTSPGQRAGALPPCPGCHPGKSGQRVQGSSNNTLKILSSTVRGEQAPESTRKMIDTCVCLSDGSLEGGPG